MARNRSILSIIGKAIKRLSQPMLTRKKRDNKVSCYCNQCNGKLVLKRTKLFHESTGGSTTKPIFTKIDFLIVLSKGK